MRHGTLLLIAALVLGCDATSDTRPRGLRPAPFGKGPQVIFDLDARPLPEIPVPNDLATRPDPSSPTGRRLNLSLIGPTLLESEVRRKADQLDGFGVFAPITVRFDALIDVHALRERHRNQTVVDDALYLVNVDPDSRGYGEIVWLDVGYYAELPDEMRTRPDHTAPRTGRFASVLDKPNQYFDYDPRAGTVTMLYETVLEEDTNGNGVLDPAEDTDGDGVWDHPNTLDGRPREPGSVDEADSMVPFYELETHTLVIRAVTPLREATTYAVVLTRFITDREGRPIRSPFLDVNHTRQTDTLKPLADILPQHGANIDDVAFAWAFTTQSATLELETIRRGLYGDGVLAYLRDQFPARFDTLWPWSTPESRQACADAARSDEAGAKCTPKHGPRVLDAAKLRTALGAVFPLILGNSPDNNALLDSYRYVDYFIAGTFTSPNFLVDRDGLSDGGLYPQDDDESFEIDLSTGEAAVGPGTVTFWCAIPRKDLDYVDFDGQTKRHEQPFPVVLYGHGYGGARLEMLGFAGHHARFGLATCAIDAFGHGTIIPPEYARLIDPLLTPALKPVGLDPASTISAIITGRARDLNNDGVPDVGGDFWTADTFHTRDMVRQSAVDQLQLVRLLRGFDGERKSAVDLDGDEALTELAGDFNGDGVPDIGGPGNDFFSWGQSLGGILSVLAPAVEPAMVAAAPTCGGAGLVDIGIRSRNAGVPEVVVLRMMGPLILGDPVYDPPATEGAEPVFTGRWRINWMVPNASPPADLPEEARVFVAEAELRDGDVFVVRNLSREANTLLALPDRRFAPVRWGQGFRTQFAADAWSATEKRGRLGFDPTAEDFAPYQMSEPEVLASGDRFAFEIYSADDLSAPRQVIDQWQADTEWQGTVYPAGTPLVAPAEGLGHRRQTPDLRRFFGIAQAILDAGDPAAYATRYFNDPIDLSDIEPDREMETRAIVVVTNGDQNVPVNSGLALARAMGLIDFRKPRQDLYGLTEDDFLLATGVYEGSVQYPRWIDDQGPYLFDPDDLDNGTDELATDPRGNARLRLTKRTPGGGVAAMRVPYMQRSNRHGDTHGFDQSSPSRPFDINTFMANQLSLFFLKRGKGINEEQLDARCLEFLGDDDRSCRIAPLFPAED